jgi:hypothetical protein
MSDSNFGKLMRAFAVEFGRNQEILNELAVQHNITNTVNLLEEWESALGIPDDCFSNALPTTIEDRQRQCVAKFAKMNIAIYDDWIALAKWFNYDISISYGSSELGFPLTLPFTLGTSKEAKFTIYINFLYLPKPSNVFPLTLPFTLGSPANIMVCLFNELKPANVRIIYRYLG